MKLKSKIIISFCIIIFVPIVLMMAALFSFQRIQVKAIEQTYGIKENNYSYFSNSMQLLSRFTKECFKELKDTAKNDPARLEDQGYLDELNQTLEQKSSYLIVRKGKELIYIGEDASVSLLTQLPSYGDTVKDEDAGTYIDGDEQVLIKQIDFKFGDGSDGSAFIVTVLEETVPEVKKLLIDVLVSIILILVLTATMLTIWMYTSMINPIKKLQMAAQNIKDGNLDFSVESDSKDEIGDSKLQAENGLNELASDDFKVVNLRPCMIYGTNGKGNFQRLARLALKTPVFPLWHNKRSMLYIDNLCEFVKQVIDRQLAGTFHLQNKEYADTVEIVRYYAKANGHALWCTRLFNPLVWLGSFFLNPLCKMFANQYYEQDLTTYDFEYLLVSFEDSLKRIKL